MILNRIQEAVVYGMSKTGYTHRGVKALHKGVRDLNRRQSALSTFLLWSMEWRMKQRRSTMMLCDNEDKALWYLECVLSCTSRWELDDGVSGYYNLLRMNRKIHS